MISAFSIALSALKADSTAINVVGNNLANLNTTGFKASTAVFQDMMSQSIGVGSGSGQVGMGVGPLATINDLSQGTLTTTNGATDVAIQGNGYFIVSNASNQTLYTRDGTFQIDSTGNLVTVNGDHVQGWSAVGGVLNPNGPIGNISVPVGGTIPATATTTISLNVNLNAEAPTTGTGSTFSAPIQVFDSQGSSHTLTITFTKTGANTWDYDVTVPNADLATPLAAGTPLLHGTLPVFDANGALPTPATLPAPPVAIAITGGWADGANTVATINWNLYDSNGVPSITQYAQASGVGSTTQDGAAAGQVVNVGLQNGGLVVAKYSNGQQLTVGQLALATFQNPDSLLSVGNNELATTPATSPAAIGTANSGSRGQIVAGSLETSTTDMATEFTNLLTYQRSYQAASRVITTSDQLTQETVNLIRP